MTKWNELKDGDPVVWERTDGVRFFGTVVKRRRNEVEVEFDSYSYGLLSENAEPSKRRLIDSRQLRLTAPHEVEKQEKVLHLSTDALTIAAEACERRGQPLSPIQEIMVRNAVAHTLMNR